MADSGVVVNVCTFQFLIFFDKRLEKKSVIDTTYKIKKIFINATRPTF